MIRADGSPVLLKGLLGASLALNLVLGGVLWWRSGPDLPPVSRMQAHLERILPEPDRSVFQRSMEKGRPGYEAARAAVRESHAAVRAALTREPFDPAALRAAMAASRERWGEFGRLFEDSLATGLTAVSPEGRRLIAEDMARDSRRHRGERD
ncbi:periplasmic heavy metal sensor [Roseomonas sp. M0104]|uniref:Periplasmic heavy metal sensor n=1 Tax=Teichococcus coralli TaxID=2545983 RepID=A0A845BML2_9PROT|nr:periplasmic heavy metal sensor [Pseudoroseomonas coralli]MXP64649.1 periplasmic heavy metal sensor [Pseudoroseomonas coralli]